ncbi:hypothetical protein BY458DRAFT_540297 [Sporodiniella umbellata]|nr:hypothetical protein BY458DRAFT_540297 [Sporodiniella umbellata]
MHPLPAMLIGFSFVCLGVGLYDHLNSDIQLYPPHVRQPLLKALYYRDQKSDLDLALKYFQEALHQARSEPVEPEILISVLIQLGAIQTTRNDYADARRTLTLALDHLVGDNEISSTNLPWSEQVKVLGITQQLGDITSAMKMDNEAEKWYTLSVDRALHMVSQNPQSKPTPFDQEHMPTWLTHLDFKLVLEKLGAFYTSRDKPDLAIDLYMRALTLIGVDSCQSTILMNNLVESFARLGQYEDAKLWGQKGLDIAQNPNTGKVNQDSRVCEQACGVLLFNMGMLFEQTKDQSKAISFYQSARQHGRVYKQADCIKEADKALRRIEFEVQRDNTRL